MKFTCKTCYEDGEDDLDANGICPYCIKEKEALEKDECMMCKGSFKGGDCDWGLCDKCRPNNTI